MDDRYYTDLAACFIRGHAQAGADEDWPALESRARHAGLRLHKFKRNAELPRVARVLGMLRSIHPESLLDLGSGRGTFLWPLMSEFPLLPVTSVEIHPRRLADLAATRRGGLERLQVAAADFQRLPFRPDSFDVVTMLEVLEHVADPGAAARCAFSSAKRFVVVTVPSKPDDNPEHIHLFTEGDLSSLFTAAGATRLHFDGVLNHRLLLVRKP